MKGTQKRELYALSTTHWVSLTTPFLLFTNRCSHASIWALSRTASWCRNAPFAPSQAWHTCWRKHTFSVRNSWWKGRLRTCFWWILLSWTASTSHRSTNLEWWIRKKPWRSNQRASALVGTEEREKEKEELWPVGSELIYWETESLRKGWGGRVSIYKGLDWKKG